MQDNIYLSIYLPPVRRFGSDSFSGFVLTTSCACPLFNKRPKKPLIFSPKLVGGGVKMLPMVKGLTSTSALVDDLPGCGYIECQKG